MNTQNTIVDNKPEVLQSVAEFAKCITTDTKGNVSFIKGATPTVDGLAAFVASKANESASVGIVAANTLRLARQMDDVKIPVFKDGKPVLKDGVAVVEEKDAFEVAVEKVRAQCVSDDAFYGIQNLVSCLELADKNGLTVSPFVVKEAMGYLNKVKAVREDGTLKGNDRVVKALKEGNYGVNSIRPVIQSAKDAKPDIFPKKKKASTSAAPAKNEIKEKLETLSLSSHILAATKVADELAKAGKGAEARTEALKVKEQLKRLALLSGLEVK